MRSWYALLAATLTALACRTSSPRERLLAADSAHAHATATEGLAAGFARYLSDSAVYLEPNVGYIRGRTQISAHLTAVPAGTVLRFRPARVDVSSDGAVGYTFGWTELAAPDSAVRYGKYIAFWRRQADGAWKVEAWNRSGALDAPAAPPAGPTEPAHRQAAPPSLDMAAEARALLGVDSAFAAASVARGAAQAFAEYAAPDGVSLGGGKDFVVGRQAIRDEQAGAPGQMLQWAPAFGGVGPLGDLGWTVGDFIFTASGTPPRAVYGKYLTVWERTPSGGWQFVVDGGSGNPAPGSGGPAAPPGP
jgi:ketosteroid isomerase-like protein